LHDFTHDSFKILQKILKGGVYENVSFALVRGAGIF